MTHFSDLLTVIDSGFARDAANMIAALGLGAIIGVERQWRQRLAGLRTNTLVSLGAATFFIFASHFTDASPTQVAAQVVTGIGFLGAGVISKEGLNVRGLNTAATLWCTGAVGLLAGSGYWRHAALTVALVIFINLALRPLIALINRQPLETAEVETSYVVSVVCKHLDEEHVRAMLLHGFTTTDLSLRELESSDIEGSDRVEVTATVVSPKRREIALEYIVGRLSLQSGITSARWRTVNTLV